MGSAEAASLRERIEALEKLLLDANAELAKLQADKDHVVKCEFTSSFFSSSHLGLTWHLRMHRYRGVRRV